MEILNQLRTIVESPLTGFSLAILSVLLTIYLDRKNRSKRTLLYRIPEEKTHENFAQHTSDRNKDGHLCGLKIALWNGGNDTIRRTDIPRSDPLRFVIQGDSRFLSARIINESRPANELAVQLHPNRPYELDVVFEYLDPNDGGIVELVYEGEEPVALNMAGSIMGIGGPTRDFGRNPRSIILTYSSILLLSWTIAYIGHQVAASHYVQGLILQLVGFLFYPVLALYLNTYSNKRDVPAYLTSYRDPPDIFDSIMRQEFGATELEIIDEIDELPKWIEKLAARRMTDI